MTLRLASTWIVAFGIGASSAWAQETVTGDVQQGHRLAILICSNCHIAARDQPVEPILRPPAPSFDFIAQRSNINANSIRTFLTTTHRDISNPEGMPNPQLLDPQIRQATAYLLSLRRQPGAQAVPCSLEIARLEMVLDQAKADRKVVGTAPESAAARLHRQPTPQTVQRAATEAEKTVETALLLARKFYSEGMDAKCIATLEKVALPLGVH
jgi:hypothetical protein